MRKRWKQRKLDTDRKTGKKIGRQRVEVRKKGEKAKDGW